MEYRRFNDKIVMRIDADEEILEQLKNVSLKENIKLASVSGLGATNDFTVGVYDVSKKEYFANSFKGNYEIVSLVGTINTMDDEFYTHIHMSCGDDKGSTFGGHLNRAIISATCEIVIDIINGRIDRIHDDKIGLNLFKF